jgi:hypothetical protein
MKRGQKFPTQDGREAIYIARDKNLKRPLIFRVGNEVWTRQLDGRHCCNCDGFVYPAIFIDKPINN